MSTVSLSPTSSHNDVTENQEDSSWEQQDPFLQLMNRGSYLRRLRLLALQDEMERFTQKEEEEQTSSEWFEEKKCEDVLDSKEREAIEVHVSPGGERTLDYSVYLSHQRYYDDLKHVDMKYIDYGHFGGGQNLIVEQRKQLGKGGFCWDAAFILGEHVVAHESAWNAPGEHDAEKTTVLELGAGTGLCGMMIAKSTNAHVILTDLPELMGLIGDNVQRNFPLLQDSGRTNSSRGTVESRVLRWGVEDEYRGAPFDVIVGADIVASLYDPIALAQTLHALAGPKTKIYISSKSRLDKPHEEFDAEMRRLFHSAERVQPQSRLKNPHVFVMVFQTKRDCL